MTIDDESSVYVGGLPYDATEDAIRRVFSPYGDVIAVKIINDHTTRGKCYGFVTFTNPRSAYDAINDMDGRTIKGRVVRVNEVNTRGGRSSLNRVHSRRGEWDRGWDRERDRDHDRERYRDRYSDRSTELDQSRDHDTGRERGYEHHGHESHDRAREYSLDRANDRDVEDNVQGENRDQIQDWERDHELNLDQNREIDRTNGYHRSVDMDKEQDSRRWNGSIKNDQHSRGLSSDSIDDFYLMKLELEADIKDRDSLKITIPETERRLEEEKQTVLDLQERAKTLDDALIAAKKLTSRRKMQLTKLHRSFLQVKEYREKLKSCEEELQSLVDAAMLEHGDDVAKE